MLQVLMLVLLELVPVLEAPRETKAAKKFFQGLSKKLPRAQFKKRHEMSDFFVAVVQVNVAYPYKVTISNDNCSASVITNCRHS